MSNKIDLIIVGAEKSGTTSLLRYLSSHSEICVHKQLEFPYFVLDEEYGKSYEYAFNRYFGQCREGQKIIAKNVGVMYSESALARLKEHNPDVQIVFLLRNPIERAYSAYWYSKRKGRENARTFVQAISLESERLAENPYRWRHNGYRHRGEYSRFIHMALKYFPREQLQIYLFEEFREDPSKACEQIFDSLGLGLEYGLSYARRYNQASMPRSKSVNQLLASNSGYIRIIKNILPKNMLRSIKKIIERLNRADFEVPPMDKGVEKQLIKYFGSEPMNDLRRLGVDVDVWKF